MTYKLSRRGFLGGAVASATARKAHAIVRGVGAVVAASGLAAQIVVPSGAFAGTYNYAMAGGSGQTVTAQQSYTDWGRGGSSQFTMVPTLITNSGLANFRLYFEVDTAGTQNVTACRLEYGDGSATSGAVDIAAGYTITITNNGTTVYSTTVAAHPWCTRWRVCSQNGGTWAIGNPRPVTQTAAQLLANFYLPPYSGSGLSGAGSTVPTTETYTILGNAGLVQPMIQGGNRPEIGPFTEWQAYYLCTGNAIGNIFQIAEAACSWNLVYRDTRASGGSFTGTLAPLDCTPTGAFQRASLVSGASPGGTLVQTVYQYPYVGGSNMTYDAGHSPNFSYLAFMMTGDPYYLENIQFQMNRDLLNFGQGFRYSNSGRYMAWPIRTAMMAVICTGSSTPNWLLSKTQVNTILTQYGNTITQWVTTTPSNLWTGLNMYTPSVADPLVGVVSPWENDYQTIIANLGVYWNTNGVLTVPTGILTLAAGLITSAVNRTNGTSGWNKSMPNWYDAPVGGIATLDASTPLNIGDTTITLNPSCALAFANAVSGGLYPTTAAPSAIFPSTFPFNVVIAGNTYTITSFASATVWNLSAPSTHAAGVNQLVWGPNVTNWPDEWNFQNTAGATEGFTPIDNTHLVNTGTGIAGFYPYFNILRCGMAMGFTAGTAGSVNPTSYLNGQLAYANVVSSFRSDWKWMISPTT
jgi:hypothetical protein